jgi:hypothetical protein
MSTHAFGEVKNLRIRLADLKLEALLTSRGLLDPVENGGGEPGGEIGGTPLKEANSTACC